MKNIVILTLLLSFCIFPFLNALHYEIVPFDYADEDMREQICAMVRDDREIQQMTYETEDSMRQYLQSPDFKSKSNCFVCRATDGSGTVYGYMMYVM